MKIEKAGENAVKITGVQGVNVVSEEVTPEQLLGSLLKYVASPKKDGNVEGCSVCAGN